MFNRLKRTKFAEVIDDDETDVDAPPPMAKPAPKRATKRKANGEGPKPAAKRGKKVKKSDEAVTEESNAAQEAAFVDEKANVEVEAEGTDKDNVMAEEHTDAVEQDAGHDSDATVDESTMQLDTATEGKTE